MCGSDRVHLVTLRQRPALLEVDENQNNKAVLSIAVRATSGWADTCTIAMTLTPNYGIKKAFCSGEECSALSNAAIRAVNATKQNPARQAASGAGDVQPPERAQWAQMITLLDKVDNKDPRGLVTFGEKQYDVLDTFVGWDIQRFPIRLNGGLFLGEMGTAGFGSHFGEDQIVNVYRLVNDKMRPIAGFYLHVVRRVLSGTEVRDRS